MGQGLFTKVAQVVAEEFGVPLHFVRITATNTAKVPNASPTAASSGTDLNGMAAKIAAGTIRERMAAFAAEAWNVAPEAVEFRDARVFAGNVSMSFGELAKACRLGARAAVALRLLQDARDPLGSSQGEGASVPLLRLWRGLLGGRDRHADRRDAGPARRPAARCRLVDQSSDRHGAGRRRVHPGHGLADDRGTGVRRRRKAAHPRARDLQDPRRLGHASDFQHPPFHAAQSDAQHLPFEGGRRTAVDARNIRLFRDSRRGARNQSQEVSRSSKRPARRN